MAFFDKLNTLAKNVGDKANDAIEITKLNSKINSEKTAISESFRKIGEYYYERYTSMHKFDSEVSEFLSSIDANNAAILELEAQVKFLKEETAPEVSADSVICPSCGKANISGIKFCSECGAKLEAAIPQTRICPSCGAAVAEGVKFCGECGEKME